ncbi:MAG: hypothetical protein AB1401_14700 [Thermodesulfobacteriota bacterium]
MITPNQEWQELCKEFDIARDELLRTYHVVTQKFTSMKDNPTKEEARAFNIASSKLDDIDRRMREFVERNT